LEARIKEADVALQKALKKISHEHLRISQIAKTLK